MSIQKSHLFARLLRCERGATALEYALIASLISIVIVGAASRLGLTMQNHFNNVATNLP